MEINKIHNMDCIEGMKLLHDNFVDLTVTSPPYDDLRTYNGYVFNFEETAKELYRVTKQGGIVVWVVSDSTVKGSETGTSFKQALFFKEIGFNLHDTMIYHKDNPPPIGGKSRYYSAFEYMFILSKGKPKTFNEIVVPKRNKWNDKRTKRYRAIQRDKDGSFIKKEIEIKDEVKKQNVWTYVVSGGSSATDKVAYKHPAIFPEKLAEDHILSWSNERDIIFDPFMGSGTTAKMAKINNRQYLGFEISPEYVNVANERLSLVLI